MRKSAYGNEILFFFCNLNKLYGKYPLTVQHHLSGPANGCRGLSLGPLDFDGGDLAGSFGDPGDVQTSNISLLVT